MMPGNPVVGSTILRRPAIQSPNYVAGSSGWTVNADGSAEFNNLTIRGTFDGTDFEINSSGAFFYSGVPASGNLIASIAPAAGTDAHGNAYVQGIASYTVISAVTYAVRAGASTVAGSPTPGFFLNNQGASPPSEPPVYSFGNANSSGTAAVMYSGKATAGATASSVECADSVLSGVAGGAVVISSGNFNVDASGNLTMGNSLVLTPKMATPPNTAAVKAQTATLAQTEACLGSLIQSMQNRG